MSRGLGDVYKRQALYRHPRYEEAYTKVKMVANRVENVKEGQVLFDKLNAVVTRYLKTSMEYLGCVPQDPQVVQAVMQQVPVSIQNPGAKSSQAYQRIAEKTGIYVICCTGFHKELFMPSWFKEKKSSQIYDEVLNEIENGIDKTSIRPGVIKMGTSFENITDQERRAVEIVARLHQDTGIMISTHCDKGTMGIEPVSYTHLTLPTNSRV